MKEELVKQLIAKALITAENIVYIKLKGNVMGYHELHDVFIESMDHNGEVRGLEDGEWRDFHASEVITITLPANETSFAYTDKPILSINTAMNILRLTFHSEITMETVYKTIAKITPSNADNELKKLEHELFTQVHRCCQMQNQRYNKKDTERISKVIKSLRDGLLL